MAVSDLLNGLGIGADHDVLCYAGSVTRVGYHKVCGLVKGRRHANVTLVLATYGGDADAAYRIGRALRNHYAHIRIVVPGSCKSAGSLLCIGAHELVVFDTGELGPLDVQVSKQNEMFERSSGLDLIQALDILQRRALDAFTNYVTDIRLRSGITTKMAADIASQLAVGLFAPIYAQIDPVRLGEMQRAVQIAYDYGERLDSHTKNLRRDSLRRLIVSYPSHGFVIDRKEAGTLFKNVREPTPPEVELVELLGAGIKPDITPVFVERISAELFKSEEESSNAPQPAVRAAKKPRRSTKHVA